MQWALLGIIVIGLFLISGRYPRIAFSALGAIVLGVGALILLTEDDARNARSAVDTEQIEIGNFAVNPAYAGSYKVTGRATNGNDNSALKGFTLNVIMEDCSASDECVIVGQSTERVVIDVPPGQARDFSANLYFGRPDLVGEARWRYTLSKPRS